MDWKAWYRAETQIERGRDAVATAVARRPKGDPEVRAVLRARGAASFPHTTLVDSAEPLARVATSIVAEGFEGVVALGVLHGSTLPEPERSLAQAAGRGDPDALARVGGAFSDPADAETPFGVVPAGPMPARSAWVRPGGSLLASEFSLDLFLAVLVAAAHRNDAPPPAVTRVFVGPVGAAGGTPIAAAVADAIRPLLGPGVALVATGDLVHAGNGYSTPEEVAALPQDPDRLRSHFESRARRMLDAGFAGPEGACEAEAIAREIRSDQRHVMPVLAALLGPGARPRLLSFRLTDYGPILGHPPPCVVATALATVEAPEL